uniref:Uncharacterized protein n=1 Tax=Physcomitrium patens TaxID=3218 RepID=A0A2K1IJH1_PHYPA|nr:hypothetical protein PHYPA_028117 [Physcomitrium patens]
MLALKLSSAFKSVLLDWAEAWGHNDARAMTSRMTSIGMRMGTRRLGPVARRSWRRKRAPQVQAWMRRSRRFPRAPTMSRPVPQVGSTGSSRRSRKNPSSSSPGLLLVLSTTEIPN